MWISIKVWEHNAHVKNNDSSIGMLYARFEVGEEESTMTDLWVHPNHRGQRLGIWMMTRLREELTSRDIRRLYWSDCTDRYRKSNNMYILLGATYVLPDADPEMVWEMSNKSDMLSERHLRLLARRYEMRVNTCI